MNYSKFCFRKVGKMASDLELFDIQIHMCRLKARKIWDLMTEFVGLNFLPTLLSHMGKAFVNSTIKKNT